MEETHLGCLYLPSFPLSQFYLYRLKSQTQSGGVTEEEEESQRRRRSHRGGGVTEEEEEEEESVSQDGQTRTETTQTVH